jgi:hypothetical protein
MGTVGSTTRRKSAVGNGIERTRRTIRGPAAMATSWVTALASAAPRTPRAGMRRRARLTFSAAHPTVVTSIRRSRSAA